MQRGGVSQIRDHGVFHFEQLPFTTDERRDRLRAPINPVIVDAHYFELEDHVELLILREDVSRYVLCPVAERRLADRHNVIICREDVVDETVN